MISRRQIVRGQQEATPAQTKRALKQQQQQASNAGNGANSQHFAAAKAANTRQQQQQQQQHQQLQQQQQQRMNLAGGADSLRRQEGSSDGYQYEDYFEPANSHSNSNSNSNSSAAANARQSAAAQLQRAEQQALNEQQEAGYRHFDPYSIYGEEEEIWYSEERLFEDHLEEIFNKWRYLDDDIWCKLIIMERNRRIGKAYARVPVVTIDGSHTLSYDGYKLAINGFDNLDRDPRTEECRKRIGKGIRIKMDHFGNILIKRLSKAGVFVKEWLPPSGLEPPSFEPQSGLMPSRQQLIKNQLLAAGAGQSQLGPSSSAGCSSATPSSSASSAAGFSGAGGGGSGGVCAQVGGAQSGSSMEASNDSAVCDEVLSVGGRLEHDKIYVMFDMKKFQANITQELCRAYPDKRKLEQQCFSIVGLARDSHEILELPCWVMVINIVAIEMLNERFPSHRFASSAPNPHADHALRTPAFVSAFEAGQRLAAGSDESGGGAGGRSKQQHQADSNKEEDPYSLPANASSSDVKSSINDYSSASTKNISQLMLANEQQAAAARYYAGPNSRRAEMYAHKRELASSRGPSSANELKLRASRSNGNIYAHSKGANQAPSGNRYNNHSSIYSPGHMLHVVPAGDAVPPKLPPRDFVGKKEKSRSSSNVAANDENIYATGPAHQDSTAAAGVKVRKTKKNRFLESLRAPLELAKGSSSRSASVLGQPVGVTQAVQDEKKAAAKSKGGAAKNLKSFLGVSKTAGKQQQQQPTAAAVAAEAPLVGDACKLAALKRTAAGSSHEEVDSVVDSSDELDCSAPSEPRPLATNPRSRARASSSGSASYNDLDIPTPDYETDENIYALEEGVASGNLAGRASFGPSNKKGACRGEQKATATGHNKEDLYYSGYRAHVPSGNSSQLGSRLGGVSSGQQQQQQHHQSRDSSRLAAHLAAANKLQPSGRPKRAEDSSMIYGSSANFNMEPLAQPQAGSVITGSRYRSASMQRYYAPRSQTAMASATRHEQLEMYRNSKQALRKQQQLVDLENPYALSNSALEAAKAQAHYGFVGAQSGVAGQLGLAHRRRSSSRLGAAHLLDQVGQPGGHQVRAGSTMASSSHYDVGRSSSGIYGNNSSSSSSDYADWQPQMRKVSSSGYLNSIFKSHLAADSFSLAAGGRQQASRTSTLAGAKQINARNHERHYAASRTLKSTGAARPLPANASQAQAAAAQQNALAKHHHQQVAQQLAGNNKAANPNYRSYDSSNDSEPSYTNSSDGLDIYDQIEAHNRFNHHQFLDLAPAGATRNLTPEVHVGEWENMYDR